MDYGKIAAGVLACALTTAGICQQTPNTWVYIGPNEGWPQERQGRCIFAAYVPPTDLDIGSRGSVVFFGRSNDSGGRVRPWKWSPPTYLEGGAGTFVPTGNDVSYELF
jgi:hypothetical protein